MKRALCVPILGDRPHLPSTPPEPKAPRFWFIPAGLIWPAEGQWLGESSQLLNTRGECGVPVLTGRMAVCQGATDTGGSIQKCVTGRCRAQPGLFPQGHEVCCH